MKSIPPYDGRRALCTCFHPVVSTCCTILLCGIVRVSAVPPTVTVVDIIPQALSGETDPNSEPNLAVNPANPSQIAASAWLPEPMGGNTSSILVSNDGGATWSCRSTVPMNEMQCDVTLRFGGLNMLYLAALNDNYDFLICRSNDLAQHPMDDSPLRQLGTDKDQPYITAATIDKRDRVFVGVFDWNGPPGRNAYIFRSVDGIARAPNCTFTPVPIEFAVPPPLRDEAEVRPAVSVNGKKVYAVFNRLSSVPPSNTRVGDVILVRDDDGGNSGAASFMGLDDASGVAGFPVVKGRTFLFDWDDGITHYAAELGHDRLGGDLAIAVDSRDPDNVYLVWGEVVANQPVLHVTRSKNGGQQWSTNNLYTVVNAKNPGLAINSKGTLALLYQRVGGSPLGRQTWVTELDLTNDGFKTVTSLPLSTFPVAEIAGVSGQPLLGDYLHLMAVGDVFYGIFSASNVPDQSRFPYGVTFQRYTDPATKKLLDKNGNEVASSIDPFFFKVLP